MRNFKVRTKVAQNFNDDTVKPRITYEAGEPITLDRDRYEELLSKGFVEVGEEIKEEDKKFEIKKNKKVEE